MERLGQVRSVGYLTLPPGPGVWTFNRRTLCILINSGEYRPYQRVVPEPRQKWNVPWDSNPASGRWVPVLALLQIAPGIGGANSWLARMKMD